MAFSMVNFTCAKVYGYSLAPDTNQNLYNLLKINNIIESSEIGNICDLSNLKKSIKNAQPEVLFHLAAQLLVRLSYDRTN